MALEIRPAVEADAGIVGALIHAMDRHYSGDRARPAAEAAAMAARVLARREGTRFTLAFAAGEAVGIACWVVMRPGHRLGGALFVKDLFVVEAARGRGVGRALLGELARLCRDEGYGRIDLTTDRGNDGARRLYGALGGVEQDKVAIRFEGEALERLARR